MKNRALSFDFIRIFACILVIMVHVSAIYFDTCHVGDFSFLITNAFNCLGITGVPLFFLLSGALLLNPGKTFSIKKFTLHHTLRIFLGYWGTVFVYNLVYFCLDLPIKTAEVFKNEVVLASLRFQGHNLGHLWFMPVLLGLYLLTPVLRNAFAQKNTCIYFLMVFFLMGILFPTLLKFEFPFHLLLESIYDHLKVQIYVGYAGYFCLGHFICHFCEKPTKKGMHWLLITGIFGFLLTVLSCQLDSLQNGNVSSFFNEPFFLGQFLTASSLFAFFYFLEPLQKPAGALVSHLSKLTFPVYLFHPLVILFMKKSGYPFFSGPTFFSILWNILLVLITSFLLSFAVRKLLLWLHIYDSDR